MVLVAHMTEGIARGSQTLVARKGLSASELFLPSFYLCWPRIGFVLHTSPF